MLVTDRLLKRLYRCGASPAEPGEFTKRAFLNGRMDLTQAEAVMDVISAGSDLALKAAQTQLDGGIGSQVDELKDSGPPRAAVFCVKASARRSPDRPTSENPAC